MYQIWIDTGGTFTDCISLLPNNATKRLKVLSSSFLRGHVLNQISENKIQISAKWDFDWQVLVGFSFRIIGENTFVKIIGIELDCLVLESPIVAQNLDFEITSHEEAPVLAARLITNTALGQPFPTLTMRLGTTKGTNALLERKGAKVKLLVTKGFKDLLEIGTQQRPNLFQLAIPAASLLYDSVQEINERIDFEGKIVSPSPVPVSPQASSLFVPVETQASEISYQSQIQKHESIAVSFLNSYRNNVHEQAVKKQLGNAKVSLGSELSNSINYLKRTQTAVVNAYLQPILEEYLGNIRQSLGDQKLLVMTSAGSLVDAAHFTAKDSLLSGPAGGMVGAAKIAQRLGFERCLTFDMGGTSTDTARFDERLDLQFSTKIDGIELQNPTLAIETVAAGGGSICSFDGQKLTVGPESAGAYPGPACYGAGGPLTITDVNLLLGKIVTTQFGIPINVDKARLALEEIKQKIENKTQNKLSDNDILLGFEQIANEKMAEAIRRISVAKGFDPKDYPLIAFGGAGGLHGCQLADLMDIKTVILPFDGGLLSAFGIGNAQIERIATKQVLEALAPKNPTTTPLREGDSRTPLPTGEGLGMGFASLIAQAQASLAKEGITDTFVKAKLLYLRFKGQENSIEIDVTNLENNNTIAEFFRAKYRQTYGHCPQNLAIEIESARVIVSESVQLVNNVSYAVRDLQYRTQGHRISNPINWHNLEPKEQFSGPVVLMNDTSTSFIPKGWIATVSESKDVVVRKVENIETIERIENQTVELELFTNRFMAIAEEMGAQLQRTAFSVNVKDRLDFSCALLDAKAELLVNAPHIPVHLGSLGVCARLILEKLQINVGDVVITNHPKYGGSHLPDVTLISGIFTDQNELIGYAINRAHHAEIGGKTPGSMPPDATSLVEEGVVILPTYIVKNGEMQWEAIENLFTNCHYPTRAIAENLADINAALASLKTGELALKTLVKKHGLTTVHKYMNLLKEAAYHALDNALEPYKNTILNATEILDDNRQIEVKISINNDLTFDFNGTSARHENNLNANVSIIYSAILYVLRVFVNKNIPLNEGLLRNVKVILPDDSFLHPRFSDNALECPAVVGGNTEISQRLVDTLIKAFGLAACSQGTMNNLLFGNEKGGYYETICGGTGATEGKNGRSAVHQHMTNTRITDPEEMERRYAVRLQKFEIRKNSGGRGRWKGGDGIVREIEFLDDLSLTLISQHRKTPPYGLKGGQAGQCGTQRLLRANGQIEEMAGIFNTQVGQGDRLILETPGGGGWGEA